MEQNTVYNYDRKTYEYIGASKAQLDVRATEIEGKNVYILPSFSTFLKPPTTKEKEAAVFEGESKWLVKKDYRGSIYYEKNGTKHIIIDIGEVIPEYAVLEPPPEDFVEPEYVDGKWVDKALYYKGIVVNNEAGVNRITYSRIKDLGEEKVKTLKLLAGSKECKEWDDFIVARDIILEEGRVFIREHFKEII